MLHWINLTIKLFSIMTTVDTTAYYSSHSVIVVLAHRYNRLRLMELIGCSSKPKVHRKLSEYSRIWHPWHCYIKCRAIYSLNQKKKSSMTIPQSFEYTYRPHMY